MMPMAWMLVLAAPAVLGLAAACPAWATDGYHAQWREVAGGQIAMPDVETAGHGKEPLTVDANPGGRLAGQEHEDARGRVVHLPQPQTAHGEVLAGLHKPEIEVPSSLGFLDPCSGAGPACPPGGGVPASIALVPGTADSVPSTEGMLFRVGIDTDAVARFSYRYDGAYLELEPGVTNTTVTVGLPIGLPLDNGLSGYHAVDFRGPGIVRQDHTNADCHTIVTLAINSSDDPYQERLDIGRPYAAAPSITPRSELHAKWLGQSWPYEPPPPRIVSPAMPDGCDHVLARPPFDPPYRQIHGDGVLAGSVACNDGLDLHARKGGGSEPLCVQPGTADELVRRGVIEGDLPAPHGPRVRP